MKNRIIANIFSLIFCLSLVTGMFVTTASAASATVAPSKSSVTVGDTFTVTVKFSGSNLGSVQATLKYDSSVIEFVSGANANGGGGTVTMTTSSSSGVSSYRFTIKFTAKAAGSSKLSVTTSELMNFDTLQSVGTPSASNSVSVVSNTALSSNNNLSGIKLSSGTLTPAFSSGTVSYTVSVPNSVSSVVLTAKAADSNAKVSISGSNSLSVGTNTRTITVTAQNGSKKTYTVKIKRAAKESTSSGTPSSSTSSSATSSATSSGTSSGTPSNVSSADESIIVTVGETDMIICEDLTGVKLPSGFTADVYSYNGKEIPAAVGAGGKVVMAYLTNVDKTDGSFYIYNDEKLQFYAFNQLTISTDSYTLLERRKSVAIPDGYSETTVQIGEQSVTAWQSQSADEKDFYLIYAMSPDGNCGLYRYDSAEGTLQRYTAPAVQTVDTVTNDSGISSALKPYALALAIAAAVLLITSTVLAVVLVVKRNR